MRLGLIKQFEEIVYQHQRDIVNFHYRLVGNRFEAEDLAQETFIKAYKHFESLKDQAKLRSWLFSIARNVTLDFFRKTKERTANLNNTILENYARATAVDFQAEVVNTEIGQELERCIDQLSAQDRLIIKLLYYEGFSYKEIGALLDLNPNTLKSRLHRARKSLLTTIQGNVALRDLALSYE